MEREPLRQLVFIAIFSSFAATAAAQTQPSPAPAPDPTAPLREEVQRLQKEVDSLKARLLECSSSRPGPAASPAPVAPAAPVVPPEMAELRYQEALAAVKAIEPFIGGSYSDFHRRFEEAKVRVDGLSGSGSREQGLRKVMRIFEDADYKMGTGGGNPSSMGWQSGLELSIRGQAALAALLAAQARPTAPTPTAK